MLLAACVSLPCGVLRAAGGVLADQPQWRVDVRDDGCGFDTDRAGPDETHVGLRIMLGLRRQHCSTSFVDLARLATRR